MHILLTNDDGPLDDKTCPYIKYLVDEITATTSWQLLICVPDQQRSWIGKAHFAGKHLHASYIYTKESTRAQNINLANQSVNDYLGPYSSPQNLPDYQQWTLVNSTPAACADIGIHHLSRDPVDLVISGPNFGKNSLSLYSLTSGTIGAAMEAVTHGYRAIALSYAFNDTRHDHNVLREAAKLSVAIIRGLWEKWGEADLYTVNVPLIETLNAAKTRVKYAPILSNTWGSIYTAHHEENGTMSFLWTPDFKKVWKDGLADHSYSDSRVLLDGSVSVTPLRAAFSTGLPLEGEMVIDRNENVNKNVNENVEKVNENVENVENVEKVNDNVNDKNILNDIHTNQVKTILTDLDDSESPIFLCSIDPSNYLYEPLIDAFKLLGVDMTSDRSVLKTSRPVFHYCEYEDIDLDRVGSPNYITPSYIYRKALIRKNYLANTVRHYVAKHPQLVLTRAVPETFHLEVDYPEFLDDALDELYELRDEILKGDRVWIVKPAMSDKGQGIRLFRTLDELQEIFDEFGEGEETDEEGEEGEEKESEREENNDYSSSRIILSQLRHFVVQEYRTNPRLLSAYGNRKFHLRTYVVCSGDFSVYVYRNILALFAGSQYEEPEADPRKLGAHLTNTCLQDEGLVVPFWALEGMEDKERVFARVSEVVREVFVAAVLVDKMNFQPVSTAVEMFGVDLLVGDDGEVTLLEINAYPDFKQTGSELKGLVDELISRVVREVVAGKLGVGESVDQNSPLVRVV